MTEVGDTPKVLAMERTERPCDRYERISLIGRVGGRPIRVPLARVAAMPALTRSRINEASNSAKLPNSCMSSRPVGVVRSMLSFKLIKLTPSASHSDNVFTRSFNERKSLSIFQTTTWLILRAFASLSSLCSAGRLVFVPERP